MALTRLVLLLCFWSTLFLGAVGQVQLEQVVQKKPVPTIAQQQPPTIKNDNSKVLPRSFDEKQIRKYSVDKDFVYDDNAVVGKSLWQSFWDWFWSLWEGLFGKSTSGAFIEHLFIFLMIALTVYAIVRFSGVYLGVLSGKPKSIEVPYAESLENIHEIDFREQIEAAIAAGNFRLAVRLYYLRTLKTLSDRDLINWQPDKTNSTYVSEISDLSTKELFAQLTLSFEYVWYGNFMVNSDNFNSLKERFDQFNAR